MKLLNLNKKFIFFLVSFIFSTILFSDESVDIWDNKNLNKKQSSSKIENTILKKIEKNIDINAKLSEEIEVSTSSLAINTDAIYGIYEPSENNLTLDMWLNTEGTRIKDTVDRINKINLSSYAEELFINTFFTVSKIPSQNMTDKEFLNYKIDWLIKNKKDKLIIIFLNKNNNFPNKSRIIKYLVDKDIASANLKGACEKIDLINNDVKDSYLEQFKVICLINRNSQNEAQLLLDLLREQKLSNNFFDSKVDYLLGANKKKNEKIDDSSLLNFYLSSITVSDFNYKPTKKTDKKIWQYLVAANIIKIDNIENKNQIKDLEIAANNNDLSKFYILEVYKKKKFDFSDLLNIDEVHPTLDPINARALVYQKILLSENTETKLKYLFILNDLFKKDNLQNIFKEYLNQELKNLDLEKIPIEYQAIVAENTFYKKENSLGKIKYSDKKYHTSKVMKYYVEENFSKKKTEKELLNIHKKIRKNKKYQLSLKDVILLDSLRNENLSIPKEINYDEIVKNNLPPPELLNLVKNEEIGLFLLRIVELVGEDELLDLDTQTIYFINQLFEKAGLTKLSKKILITVLPDRTEI